MTKVKHEFHVIIYSDTDDYPNKSSLDIGKILQTNIKDSIDLQPVGYDRVVLHRGYNYLTDDGLFIDDSKV